MFVKLEVIMGIPTYKPSDIKKVEAVINEIEWPYEWMRKYFQNHMNRFEWTLNKILSIKGSFEDILEFGANPYGLTILLSEHFKSITVTDFSREEPYINKVSLKTKKNEKLLFDRLNFNVEFDDIPSEDESFDLVICSEIIEHLTTDPMRMLLSARKVLRKNGVMFITTPNSTSYRALEWLLNGETPNVDPFYRKNVYGRHNRELSMKELSALLHASGFDIIDKGTISFKPDNVSNKKFYNLLSKKNDLSERGAFLYFLAKKNNSEIERYPEAERLYRASDFLEKK